MQSSYPPASFHFLVAEQVKTINQLNVKHFYWWVNYFAFLVAWSTCTGRLTKQLLHLSDVVCQHCSLRPWSCHVHCLSLLFDKEQVLVWFSVRDLIGFIISKDVLIPAEC